MAIVKTPVLKVILCGEYGVGKSSIFRRFINNTFVPNSDRRSTLGLDHFEKLFQVADRDVKSDIAALQVAARKSSAERNVEGIAAHVEFRAATNTTCAAIPSTFRSVLDLDSYRFLQLWDTGGMERIASVTSSYYKFAEAAVLVFSLDNASSFHVLSQHLLDIVTYAENAKIFLCGNKSDLEGTSPQVTDADIETFCEQCHNLISTTYKTSCKTGKGLEEMFSDIALQLVESNRSRIELQTLDHNSFKITQPEPPEEPPCSC